MSEINALIAAIQKLVLSKDEGLIAGLGDKADKGKNNRRRSGGKAPRSLEPPVVLKRSIGNWCRKTFAHVVGNLGTKVDSVIG